MKIILKSFKNQTDVSVEVCFCSGRKKNPKSYFDTFDFSQTSSDTSAWFLKLLSRIFVFYGAKIHFRNVLKSQKHIIQRYHKVEIIKKSQSLENQAIFEGKKYLFFKK